LSIDQIDPRGPRFGAALTTVVLATILVSAPSTIATGLLIFQTLVFALGAFVGLGKQPYGIIYRKLVAPRLAKPTSLEDTEPPRFAQFVGFLFAATALLGVALDSLLITQIAVGLALAAAFLNAVFAFCLGCEMYLLAKRFRA
jgi:hypothetical protein